MPPSGALLGELLDQPHRVHGMDEADPRHDHPGLAPLHVPDKVPLEAVAEALLLFDEVLGPVLADEVDAGLGEGRELLRRVVLGGDEHADRSSGPPPALQGLLNVLAHAASLSRMSVARPRRHRPSLTIEARFRPVSGPCLRCE